MVVSKKNKRALSQKNYCTVLPHWSGSWERKASEVRWTPNGTGVWEPSSQPTYRSMEQLSEQRKPGLINEEGRKH